MQKKKLLMMSEKSDKYFRLERNITITHSHIINTVHWEVMLDHTVVAEIIVAIKIMYCEKI